MHIHVNLSDECAKKIDYIKLHTHASLTQILTSASDLYYWHIKKHAEQSAKKLLQSSFIGCAEADHELSVDYKQYLADSLAKKYNINKAYKCQ